MKKFDSLSEQDILALATRTTWYAFVVGLAASLGAGISMGFAEALSDDGSLTGCGHPWIRGLVCELGVITWVRHRYMDTPAASAAIQVAFGGALVFITGVLIGRS